MHDRQVILNALQCRVSKTPGLYRRETGPDRRVTVLSGVYRSRLEALIVIMLNFYYLYVAIATVLQPTLLRIAGATSMPDQFQPRNLCICGRNNDEGEKKKPINVFYTTNTTKKAWICNKAYIKPNTSFEAIDDLVIASYFEESIVKSGAVSPPDFSLIRLLPLDDSPVMRRPTHRNDAAR